MSNRQVNGGMALGPQLEDCERLWTTIIKELMGDAVLEIRLPVLPLGQVRPKVLVTSGGFDPKDGSEKRHVWATMDLSNGSVAITYQQLHRCLAEAYSRMDGYLSGQSGLWDEATEG